MFTKHLTELLYGIWSVDHEIADFYLTNYSDPLAPLLSTHDYSQERAENRPVLYSYDEHSRVVESEYSTDSPVKQKSVAVMKINGVISKYDKTCGPEGVESHVKRLRQFVAMPEISSVILHINSPGGESNAAHFMASEILNLRENKQIIAFVDDICASAAYHIASACDYIGVNSDLAVIGSIGTYTTLVSYQKQLEKKGIEIITLYAKESTEKNIEFREALQGNFEKLQKDVDFYNKYFLLAVEKNRQQLNKTTEWKTGRKYYAQEALATGLIDFISPFNVFLESVLQ